MFQRARTVDIERARRLRRDATDVEKKLWWKLRELNRQGYHFRRQAPFHGYILDFAEHGARIVIELDGGQHGLDENRVRDEKRDAFLTSQSDLTLRFWNSQVVEDIDAVMEEILRVLKHRPPPGALRAPTSPQRRR